MITCKLFGKDQIIVTSVNCFSSQDTDYKCKYTTRSLKWDKQLVSFIGYRACRVCNGAGNIKKAWSGVPDATT